MITFLDGILEAKQPTQAVLNVNGIGYELTIPVSSFDRLPSVGDACRVLVHDYVREDAHLLFGFMTEEERRIFRLLIGVNGIGPKIAVSALSRLTAREIVTAVSSGDVGKLSSVSGVGKKMAERMIVDLRDRLDQGDVLVAAAGSQSAEDGRMRDAVLALVALGYKQEAARKMVNSAMKSGDSDISVESIIRRSLTG